MTQTATLQRRFPTFFWMLGPFRWVAASRRRMLGTALVVLAIIAAGPIWWATQLLGLPDVGEPFDVEAFRSQTIPDDRNAFVLYRRAEGLLRPRSAEDGTATKSLIDPSLWSAAKPEDRRWAELNRDALEMYRQATDRPDALDANHTRFPVNEEMTSLRHFQSLASLEASRLEDQGDMAGAWVWLRANLRMTRLLAARGTQHRRSEAQAFHDLVRKRAAAWAADSRTTPEQIRQALDDVLACEAIVPSNAFTLKAEYLIFARRFPNENYWILRPIPRWLAARPMLLSVVPPEQWKSLYDAWLYVRREPERRLRVVRLFTANRAAYYDLPPERRPKPDPYVTNYDLYAFGPEAPPKARALSPEALAGWLDSCETASVIQTNLSMDWFGAPAKEVANHHDLVLQLAAELYRRDHGAVPAQPEDLVGPYLKALPPAFPKPSRDESLPVEDRPVE
ncbi:hypothetical protein [Paludisphaera rhizosphaerae]|uniref:hypothetical protein n=1 Tax=Paludisphaera rhizosphaerae TaxID=2711216 RepID=UPI0013EC898F|nr:hypothetical protein [Paludisphaera rhizosphaerae]